MLLSTFYRSMVLRSQHDVSFTWKRGSMIDLSKMLTTDPITFGHIIRPPPQKGKKGQVRLNMQIIGEANYHTMVKIIFSLYSIAIINQFE